MNIVPADQRLIPQTAHRPQRETVADLFGVAAVFRMLRRRFILMAAVAGIIAAAVFTFAMTATPKYQASSLVAINTRSERITNTSQPVLGELPRDTAAVDSEIEILRSPALTGRLVDALNLTEDPEFNYTLRKPSGVKGFLSSLINPVLRRDSAPERTLTPEEEVAWQAALREIVAASVGRSLSIRRRGLTYVIEISATSADPNRAQELANTYADLYLESQAEARVEAAQRATSWLSGRLLELREDVQRKEAAVEAFRRETGIMSTAGTSLIEQQITEVQRSVLAAQADLVAKQSGYRQLRELQAAGASLDSLADALNSDVIRGLRDREAEIARRQSDLENRYLPTHPAVEAIRSERRDIERQIQSEIQRISVGLGNQVEVARSQVQTLQDSLDALTTQLQSENANNIRLRELEREAEASQRVYESYLERYQELVDQETMNSTDARLVSYSPTPGWKVSPNTRISLAIAILAGGVLGLGAGVLAEQFDRSIHDRDDIEATLGYPMIATIPTIGRGAMRSVRRPMRNPPGYLVEKPMSAFTEALRVLRTVIVHSRLDTARNPVVAIASALPGEGKTTVALSLVRVAALSGQKVIIVDCDLRKQQISHLLDITPAAGLMQVLNGEVAWADVVQRDQQSQADVLPAAATFSTVDVFGTGAMEQLLNELREVYDLVILDCPPVFAVADARVLSGLADSVVVVARLGKSTLDAVRVAIDHIVSAGGKIEGVALNRVPMEGLGRLSGAGYSYQLRTYYDAA